MASSYRVNLLDVLRTQANSEQENRKRVLRVYGGLMALTHLLDVCAAVALVACYGGFETKAALRPFERWDFAFGHKITDVFFMALARAIVFPLLTRLAVRCGRRDGCLCAKKPAAAPEGYAALDGEERTSAERKVPFRTRADGPRSEGGRRNLLDNSRVYVRFLPFIGGRFHLGRMNTQLA